MENSKPVSNACSSQDAGKATDYNLRLRDVIINRLERISERGKEQVLEYIQELMDREERQLEFDRRQGRLYSWTADDGRG